MGARSYKAPMRAKQAPHMEKKGAEKPLHGEKGPP